jgi:transposase
MMRLGHFRPVHVKSLAARAVRTTLAVRLQLVASQLQIENTIRGLLKVYGLKIRAIHRNRFAARVAELLAMASLPGLAAAIEPMRFEHRRTTGSGKTAGRRGQADRR